MKEICKSSENDALIFGLEAAGYDNMKGSERLRIAFKKHANRIISPNFTWHEDDDAFPEWGVYRQSSFCYCRLE